MQQQAKKTISYHLRGIRRARLSHHLPQTIHLTDQLLLCKNKYQNHVCHILGNGPSLTEAHLSPLKDQLVIGCNASPKMHHLIAKEPEFYCISDRRFLRNHENRLIVKKTQNSIRVFAGYCHGYLNDFNINYIRIIGSYGISNDIESGIYHSGSVVLFASQLALWLGCKDIIWHGCEFDYQHGRFYSEQRARPNDKYTFPHIQRNVLRLIQQLQKNKGSLSIVGPSRLTGSYGFAANPQIHSLTTDDWLQQFKALSLKHTNYV